MIRRLVDLYGSRRERLTVLGLVLAVLLGSALEIVGIGVFLPFMRIISEPGAALENARLGPVLRTLGIVDREGIILASSAGLVLLFALKNAYLALQWRLLHGFLYAKLAQVSSEIFGGYLRSPYTFHLKRNSAQLIQTVSEEVKHAFNNVVYQLVVVSAEVVVAAGVIAVLFLLNSVAALGGLLFVGLLGWGVARIQRKRLAELGDVRSQATEQKYRLLQQGLGGIKEIRILRREAQFLDRFERAEGHYVRALRDSVLLGHYPRLIIELAAVLLLAGMVSLLLLSGGGLTEVLPTLAVFGVAVIRLVPAAAKITSGVSRLRFYEPSLAMVHREWLEATRGTDELRRLDSGPSIEFRRAIEFEDVDFTYPEAAEPALRELTLTIARGQSVGFVGFSGAGKTTLLYLLLGLLKPTSGRIAVDGRDLNENVGSWQRQIGYIPQDLYLLDDSIRRNVAFGVPDEEIDDSAVWRALEAAQLATSIRNLDAGLDALTGERGARLSGGQGQRLAIARALYTDPPVLILDEATSSLDYETEARIAATLQQLAGSKTVIIVSHRHQTVKNCDVIHVLKEGRLAATGTFQEVLAASAGRV